MPEPSVAEANVVDGVKPQGAPEAKVEKPSTLPDHYTDEDRAFIKGLREEAAANRVKKNTVEEELNQIKAEIEKEKENKLKEQGKLQELLEKKEAELDQLSSVKNENEGYKQYFKEQLDTVLEKLSDTQKGVLEDSNMDIQKKLKWARQMIEEGSGQVSLPPDSVRPGGKAPTEKIDIAEYSGREGRRKLAELQQTNPILFEAIIKEKQKQ